MRWLAIDLICWWEVKRVFFGVIIYFNLQYLRQTMVESNQVPEEETGEDKTFLEQPDILDKIKAASAITDGMYTS